MPDSATKLEEPRDDVSDSMGSSPDPEGEQEHDQEAGQQELPQTQKRKGGRKPIYATSEERKQRNRQAQAAFRERRTEYIKQLETQIKQNEDALRTLQTNHRNAADECLILRYKNSLLERILLEKGIDVQGELQAKTGSPSFPASQGPPSATSQASQPSQSPMQRATMSRQQARRSGSHMSAREAQGASSDTVMTNPSPRLQPRPGSHTSTPALTSTMSPNFLPQNGMASPNVGALAQQQQRQGRAHQPSRNQYGQMHPTPPQRPQIVTAPNNPNGPMSPSLSSGGSMASSNIGVSNQSAYYSPPFRSHMDQLEQEYDAQPDVYEESDTKEQAGGAASFSYPQQVASQPFSSSTNPNSQQHQQQPQPQLQQPQQNQRHPNIQPAQQRRPQNRQGPDSGVPVYPPTNHAFDSFDPMLDADPFGLTASMQFPTQFSYESR